MNQSMENETPNITEALAKKLGTDQALAKELMVSGIFFSLIDLLIKKGVVSKDEVLRIVEDRRSRCFELIEELGVREFSDGEDPSPEYTAQVKNEYRETFDEIAKGLTDRFTALEDL